MPKKYLIGIFVVLLLLCIPLVGSCLQQEAFAKEQEFLTYENQTYGFRIKYPADWTELELNLAFGTSVLVVMFQCPLEGISSNVAIENLSRPMDLDEYEDVAIKSLKKSFTDFNLIERSDTSLASLPAKKIVYTFRQDEIKIKTSSIFTIKNNRVYVVTYGGRADNYNKFIKQAERMIDSFELL